jgi:YYY domain-containing protein
MQAFLLWYLIVSLLGWLTFPLMYALFPALSDRGYSMARTAGLLVWGYIFWLLANLGVAQNNMGGLLLTLMILSATSIWIGKGRQGEIRIWFKQHLTMILVIEGLFLLAFIALATIRAADPDILGTEKPMELAFINSILRSPTFPPNDPWLSGYGISYYYFGYVLTAMLARITGVAGGISFNLMLALVFALGCIGAYGIIYNSIKSMQKVTGEVTTKGIVSLPLLGPLFYLVVSNLEGFLEVLHRKGIFWKFSTDGSATSSFWKWLDIKDLVNAPIQPLAWAPDRYLWWWRASRVIQDTTLKNAPQELIDEFPVFSFILGDLHPHVLAIPFVLLAVGVGLHIFLGGWRGTTILGGIKFPIKLQGLFIPALLLGGLAFLNTWDILLGAALVCGAFLLWRGEEKGWTWKRIEETAVFALIIALGSLLLYLPFFLRFSSQAGGILPNLVNPTRGAQLWVMFGSLFLPIFAFLAYLVFGQKLRSNWKCALAWVMGFVVTLWIIGWLGGWLLSILSPDIAQGFLQHQGVSDLGTLFRLAGLRRLSYFGSLLTLILLLVSSFALLLGEISRKNARLNESDALISQVPNEVEPRGSLPYVLLLLLMGGVLVLAPDFVFLRDQFGWRINTIFKFYYQAWMLWSLVAALGTAVLIIKLIKIWEMLFRVGLFFLLLTALTYTSLGNFDITNNFKPANGWTLDGTAYMGRNNPDEALAIKWLQQAAYGVIVEAVGGSYSEYARISTLSGLPTVIGWPGHESQWRGGYELQGTRAEDVKTLYETSSQEKTVEIAKKYNVRYIYIGSLERRTYHVNDAKFQRLLSPLFSQGSITIYPAP